jgi:SAM-dependent methyltransferase
MPTPVRSSCRSCGSPELTIFLQLGNLPPSDALLREEDLSKEESRYPLDVAFCSNCSLVQILETVPPEKLFSESYVYFSSFSDALLAHSRDNVERLVASRKLDKSKLVVELASNDGYLLQYYLQRGIPVLGIDPAIGPVQAAIAKGVPTLHRFFTLELAQELRAEGKRADVLHANNVLAHVADTNGFVAGIRLLLKDDGVAVIEAPYVKDLIDHCEFDTIYHEHLCYFSVTALVALFKRHGLFLNHVEPLAIHGGSLRLFVEPVEAMDDSVRRYLKTEKESGLTGLPYYRDFSARVLRVKQDLGALLRRLKDEHKQIAGYGAAAKGTILLNYVGIGPETVSWIADRNVHKQGRYMPGVRIPIVNPDRLLKEMPDYVLILPWNFKDEIVRQQAEYVKRGGHFIVPIPSPVIL